ncbi:MAG: DUF934 domain-containing protein [Azonexus sp.]|nr:DUF934 domain-containing protein [Azonexus sp.]
MAQLIKHGVATTDSWQILDLAAGESPETVALPEGDVIFPLAVWQARKDEIVSRPTIGLLLQPADRVEDVAGDLASFNLIAVNFPKFVDGRGYSTAALLRQRYGYTGELRAVGDVLHDQLFFMRRVGFDSYALKDGKSLDYAIAAGFKPFTEAYQGATDQAQPYFRRRA